MSLFGNVPDVDKINKIAKKSKLFVIEDAAQSFGARYKKNLVAIFLISGALFSHLNHWVDMVIQVQYLPIIKII